MQNFNAVLIPPNELANELISFAQDKFEGLAEGYCLSNSVLPHITLCQFKAKEVPNIRFDSINKIPQPVSYKLRLGEDIHKEYVWVEIVMKPEEWLNHLHEYIKNKLNSYDAEILMKGYVPHMTLCRLPLEYKDLAQNLEIPEMFLKSHSGWTFQIGCSDENGQYLGVK